MGPQRVLQAAIAVIGALVGVFAATASTSQAAPQAPPTLRTAHVERVAVINLSPPLAAGDRDDAARRLEAAITAAGFDPVTGNGVEDALAGRDVDRDALALSAALATAQRAYGELRCHEAMPAARQAIGLAAARQAAGLAVPELARAWIYVLLCADHDGQLDAALTAATRLRTLGGNQRPGEIAAGVWAKYPVIDTAADLELVPLEITTDEPGAAVWIDFQRAGVSPLKTTLPAGDHVIAAALATRRGWASGTAVRSQAAIKVPLVETAGTWSDLARRVAGWHGQRPAPAELGWVLARVDARVALVRSGDTISAWGQLGRSEPPHPLGTSNSASGPVTDVERVLGAVADQIHTWSDHAPDPDQPLLVESDAPAPGRRRADEAEPRTKWWVYAAIAGAVVAGGIVLYAKERATDKQQIELHAP
ncbi:MAG TPA: hypothetical protein VGC42_04535 [Kofleriaceae bacterium]